jgi:hypothetical protein
MRPDIVPGGVFPDYEPPDHTKALQKLSELQFHGWNRWSPARFAAELDRLAG